MSSSRSPPTATEESQDDDDDDDGNYDNDRNDGGGGDDGGGGTGRDAERDETTTTTSADNGLPFGGGDVDYEADLQAMAAQNRRQKRALAPHVGQAALGQHGGWSSGRPRAAKKGKLVSVNYRQMPGRQQESNNYGRFGFGHHSDDDDSQNDEFCESQVVTYAS